MSAGWLQFMWFIIGLFSAFAYFIAAANDASFIYLWPFLVVAGLAIFRLWTWPPREET
jgi:hypothetical protein